MNWLDELKKSPKFHSLEPVRDLDLLYPPFRIKIELLLRKAEGANLPVMVFETFRSQERQEKLYEQKRTKIRSNGGHYFGVCADLVWTLDSGAPSWEEPFAGAWESLAGIGRRLNLIWGGDWKRFVDKPHWQYYKSLDDVRKGVYK